MNPYLEQSALWSSFHTRLLVAIADTVAPQLRPKYYIEVETRTYQDSESDEVLIGIPDATVLKSSSSHPVKEKLQPETGFTLTQKRPQSVALPMPMTVKERYLEVREIGNAILLG